MTSSDMMGFMLLPYESLPPKPSITTLTASAVPKFRVLARAAGFVLRPQMPTSTPLIDHDHTGVQFDRKRIFNGMLRHK
jgi:hypothetical protein